MATRDTDEQAAPNQRRGAARELTPQHSEGLIGQSGRRHTAASAGEPPPVARHSAGSSAAQGTSPAAPDAGGSHPAAYRRYEEVRDRFVADFAARRGSAAETGDDERTFAEAEPNYRAGYDAGIDLRYEGQHFAAIEAALRHEYETRVRETPPHQHPEPEDSATWAQLRAEIEFGFDMARAG